MSLTLLFGGGGSISPSGSDAGAATDGVVLLERSVYADTAVGSDGLSAMAFTLQDAGAGTEAATGGAAPNQGFTVTDQPTIVVEAINALEVGYADSNTSTVETVSIAKVTYDFAVSDSGSGGEAAFVSASGPEGIGGLFNETLQRDHALWNQRFQRGRSL